MRLIRNVAYYLIHNIGNKTFNRVAKAALKYPDASIYELQHGVNSVASQKYRERHPEPPEYEYIPEYVPPEPELKIFCYRDYLGVDRLSYYGVNLYFCEYQEQNFFKDVQDHFVEELELYMGMNYERTDLSECSAEDISCSVDIADFVFEISDLKHQRFAYWGHWHNNEFVGLDIFDDFDMTTLKLLLRMR